MTRKILAAALLLLTASCTTLKESNPARTATEEMLISTAADRAAQNLAQDVPGGAKTYLDGTYFEGTDSKYALGAIRSALLQQGLTLTDDKKTATNIVEVRAGALSTDNKETLVGIPSFSLPIPFASTSLTTPELAFYKSDEQKGVAKFAFVAYGQNGREIGNAAPPQYGFAHNTKYTLLLFISWDSNDAVPNGDAIQPNGFVPGPQKTGNAP